MAKLISLPVAFIIALSFANLGFASSQCPSVALVTLDLEAIRPSTEPIQFLVEEQHPYPIECKITHLEIFGSNLSLVNENENVDMLTKRFASLHGRLSPVPKIALKIPSIFQGSKEDTAARVGVLLRVLKIESAEFFGVTSDDLGPHAERRFKAMALGVCAPLLLESLREPNSSNKLRFSAAFAACSVVYGAVKLLQGSSNTYIQSAIEPSKCSIPALVGLGSGSRLGAALYPIASAYCWLKTVTFTSVFARQVCARGDRLHLRDHPNNNYMDNEFLTPTLSSYCQETIGD